MGGNFMVFAIIAAGPLSSCAGGQAVLLPQLGFLQTSILFRGRHRDILWENSYDK